MKITNRIDMAFIGDELGTGIINEAALSRRARSFLSLIKGIIGLDAASLMKLATGKQTGLAEAAKKFKFITEDVAAVQTLGMGNSYRAVGVKAGMRTFYFLTPKIGQDGTEYTDEDVIESLRTLLNKMKDAARDGNTSALQSYRETFLKSAEEAAEALSQKEQQRGGKVQNQQSGQPAQTQSPSNLKKVITPIVVQMAGKDGPNAAAMMEGITDDEINKALTAHVWDAQSMTEFARLAWASVMEQLDPLGNSSAAVVNSMAQTAVAYVTFKYLHIKAQYMAHQDKATDQVNKAQQDAQKAKEADLKLQRETEKSQREQEKTEREREEHERDGQAHQLELHKKKAEVEKKRAETEKAHAQAEAAAKRPL